jgi:PAS domain S-box-containing protein
MKKGGEALRESEQKFSIIVNSMNDIIYIVDKNFNLVEVYGNWLKIYNFERNILLGKSFFDLFEGDIKIKHINAHNKALSGENVVYEWEVLNQGKKKFIQSSLSPFRDENKEIIGIVAIGRDITELKNTEQKIENEVKIRTNELKTALEKQKLYLDHIIKTSQFKTEFLASISHDLRTPLNAIIGFTDLLLDGMYGSLNEEQQDFLHDIKDSAEHQLDMINQILDLTKIESGQLKLNVQQFSLNDMTNQVKSSLRPLFEKKELKFRIVNLESKIFINADPIRFKEILYNLLSNAIKFTIK